MAKSKIWMKIQTEKIPTGSPLKFGRPPSKPPIPHVFQHEAGCDYENSCTFALKTVCRELSEVEEVMLRLRGLI
jgi:hypothetical protein